MHVANGALPLPALQREKLHARLGSLSRGLAGEDEELVVVLDEALAEGSADESRSTSDEESHSRIRQKSKLYF